MPNRPLSRGLHTTGGQRKEASGETRTSPQGVQQGRRERPHAHAAQLHTSEAGSRSITAHRSSAAYPRPSIAPGPAAARPCVQAIGIRTHAPPRPCASRAASGATTPESRATTPGDHTGLVPRANRPPAVSQPTGGSSLWLSAQNLQFSQNNGELHM